MGLLQILLSTGLAAVPALLLFALVWFADRYDREPLWLVLLTFGWGATGAAFLALPLNTTFHLFLQMVIAPLGGHGLWLSEILGPTLGAPLFEEPAKALFLAFVAWNRRPADMSSGFVYGASAGIGFAMTENVLYFSNASAEAFATMVAVRTFYCVALHAMASAVVGAAFGFGRLRGWAVWSASTMVGLAMAMVLHALWNGLLALDVFSAADLRLANFVLLPVEVLVVVAIWQICLLDDAFSIRRELQGEEEAGLLPKGQSRALSSWWRRFSRSAFPDGVDVGRYVRTATRLARRKRQLQLLGEGAPPYYRDDVRRLRKQLAMILDGVGSVNGSR